MDMYQAYLAGSGGTVLGESNGKAALTAIAAHKPDVVLLDVQLPDANGIELISHIRGFAPECALIIMTAQASVKTAVEAMQKGADDFLVKPFSQARLATTIVNAMKTKSLEQEVASFKDRSQRNTFHGFIGKSPAMRGVYRLIELAAKSKAPVLITGESGTGKELCAEALHRQGTRAKGPLVPVNCGAIPADLIESELFGHVKGAFTGATSDRVGAARNADKGILFLDEVGDLPLDLQVKLLRFLQTGIVQAVGSDQQRQLDVRVVCATNKDPDVEVAEGRFREDLLYRLNVIPIHLPPLRERDTDILDISEVMIERLAEEEERAPPTLTEEARAHLLAHSWPGNVRELINKLRSTLVLTESHELNADALGLRATKTASANSSEVRPLALVEREAIESAIAHCDGNVVKAAEMLEVSPSTIYRKRADWELED